MGNVACTRGDPGDELFIPDIARWTSNVTRIERAKVVYKWCKSFDGADGKYYRRTDYVGCTLGNAIRSGVPVPAGWRTLRQADERLRAIASESASERARENPGLEITCASLGIWRGVSGIRIGHDEWREGMLISVGEANSLLVCAHVHGQSWVCCPAPRFDVEDMELRTSDSLGCEPPPRKRRRTKSERFENGIGPPNRDAKTLAVHGAVFAGALRARSELSFVDSLSGFLPRPWSWPAHVDMKDEEVWFLWAWRALPAGDGDCHTLLVSAKPRDVLGKRFVPLRIANLSATSVHNLAIVPAAFVDAVHRRQSTSEPEEVRRARNRRRDLVRPTHVSYRPASIEAEDR